MRETSITINNILTQLFRRVELQLVDFKLEFGLNKEGKLLFASQDGERVKLTSKNLLISYLKHPLMTLKIISAIHYEALKLWIKGIKLVKKNLKIKNNTSYEN